ncbi:hypothetical protein BDZ89DRAFT_217391 [Hymenopellis radicata]|nr:hypothetical protein BDZ89DRAFT_217391 [Hymenopellis radicata]
MLSAALNAVSPNATYLSAATESAQFMLSNFVILEPNSGRAALSANLGAGMFIEGLSLLPPDTDIGGTSVADLRRQAVFRTLTGNSKCNTVDGVIDMGKGIGNSEIVRGLGSLYRHNTTESDLRDFVRDYIGVQYNAVSDRATSGGTIYGGSWAGPPSSTFDGGNQTLALSALINAIPLKFVEDAPSTNSSTNTTDSPSGGDKSSGGSSNAGIIAGAVVGVLALVGIIIGVIFLVLRRRRLRTAGSSRDLPTTAYVPPPPMQGYIPTQPSTQTYPSSPPNILNYASSPPNVLSYTSPQATSYTPTRPSTQSAVPGAPPPSMVTNHERIVHDPPIRSTYNEKRGLTAHHVSAHSESWRSESSGQGASGSSDISAHAIETADLVRLLAERLDLDRRARSDPLAETAPPAYDLDDGRRS